MPKARNAPQVCTFLTEQQALKEFASSSAKTQSAAHIKPIHWYVCCRLVLEGGFLPQEVFPHPPFSASNVNGRMIIEYSSAAASASEKIILGGLKTKTVDVVVTKNGVGPVLAVSCRGMTGAFRNLTNRMEETIGECTNLHITYPALVFGYLFAIRANHISDQARLNLKANDIAVQVGKNGDMLAESILRFHFALSGMSGRGSIRDDYSKYESVSLALVDMRNRVEGGILDSLMPENSSLLMQNFFPALYRKYDERFVIAAPSLANLTRRVEWSPDSPIFHARPYAFNDSAYDWRLDEELD